jgi:hypothetical protein
MPKGIYPMEKRRGMFEKGHQTSQKIKVKISNSLKGHIVSEATRKKMRERVVSEETRKKMSLSHEGIPGNFLGHNHTEQTKEILRITSSGKPGHNKGQHWKLSEQSKQNIADGHKGKNNYLWKGDDVGYGGLHHWIERSLGKPTKCEHCGKGGLTGRQIHWANKDHKYKRNLIDWLRLCAKCHKKYDKKFN